MFVPHKFGYFVFTLIFFIPWIILYSHRKDLRKEMLIMGILIAFGGIICEYLWWTADWWHPQTITGTVVGLEDLLLGFSNGGIAVVIYEEVFKKRIYKRKKEHTRNIEAVLVVMILSISASSFFYIFHFTSFIATSVGMVCTALCLMYFRKDLILTSLLNGLLMVAVSLPAYYFLILFSPGWIESTWLFNHLTSIRITGIPLEDLVFYFLVGLSVAPFYEYWKSLSIRKASI